MKTGVAIVAGEVTTNAVIDLEHIVRGVIVDIGYDHSDVGFDGDTCAVLNVPRQAVAGHRPGRRPQVTRGSGRRRPGPHVRLRDERDRQLMPAPIIFSHRLVEQQAEVRKNGKLPWLRPDAKSQCTFRYETASPSASTRSCSRRSTARTSLQTCTKP